MKFEFLTPLSILITELRPSYTWKGLEDILLFSPSYCPSLLPKSEQTTVGNCPVAHAEPDKERSHRVFDGHLEGKRAED